MKKILIAAMALLLILSLCGCGESDSATPDSKPLADADEHIEEYIDTDKYQRKQGDDKHSTHWENKENESADFSDVLTLDKDDITIGKTTFADLVKLGFEIDKKAPETVEPEKSVEIPISRGDEHCSLFTSKNKTTSAVKVTDMTVGGFYITSNSYAHYSYNGINENTTLEEVLAIEDMPVHAIDVAVRGSSTLEYLTYNKESTAGDITLKVTLNIGAVYDGKTSKISYIHYISEEK